jgi:hypothetical protein
MPMTTEIIRRLIGERLTVPPIIADADDGAARRFLEFFTANTRNPNTRAAYAQAVGRSLRWCEDRRLSLRDIEPMAVAAYIESHPCSDPTQKQHLAAGPERCAPGYGVSWPSIASRY